jgi:hypothetical protein
MKKVLLTLAIAFGSLTLMAQQPEKPVLHNQFRDYVEFRKSQEMNFEKPNVEHKDGKVIITMSEKQFQNLQQMKRMEMRQRAFHQSNFRQPMVCENCKKCKKKMGEKKYQSPVRHFNPKFGVY